MEISPKIFATVIIIIVSIAIFAVCVALNVGGLGDTLAGFGGPLAAGIYEIVAFIPRWVLSGGWPTMIAGICILLAALVASGYIFEQKHIIAIVTGKNGGNAPGNYQSSPTQNMIPLDNLQNTPTKKE